MEIMAENTDVQPKLPLPPLPKTAYSTQHPKRMKSVEEKKASRKEFDRLRGKTRVNIGVAFQRWRALRNLMELKTDAELALLLLDSFPKTAPLSVESHAAPGADWTSSEESLVEASESGNCESGGWDDSLLAEDETSSPLSHSAPMEIELELTRSMTNKPLADSQEPMKLHRKDVQMKSSTANEEESCRLSESSYVTLSKDVLVFLMYRCLECSSGCCIQGKGKGGTLSLRQECLTCRNCRVWTSQAADIPKEKLDDISLILSCDDVGLQVSENVSVSAYQGHINAQTHQDKTRIKTVLEKSEAQDFISSFKVKEEHDDEREVEKSLLMETHEDVPSGQSEDSVKNDDGGFNMASVKDETAKPAELTDSEEMFIGEDGRLKPAEKASIKSCKTGQQDDSDACLTSSSYEESSGDDSEVEPSKKPQKPFQNTIKPIIWCVDCEAGAKMLCTVRRHHRIYGCRECGTGRGGEPRSFKDFSVHFGDIVTFHKHAMSAHGATENPYERTVCPDCNKSIRVEPIASKKGHICEYKIKPFACDLCRKRFFTENGQKVHYRRLHGDYTHICKYCMMAFNTKPSKLDHEQTHSEDALPYICPDCPEKFKDFVARNQHLKTHRGQKKFVCHTCNRKFVSLQRYERHMRIHSGEKPYTCEVCERSFNQDGHLKSHMRLHTGEKPFMCEQCGECFNHNVSLKNHLQRQHGIDSSRMLAEDSRQIGRPLRKSPSSEDQQKKRRRRSSTIPGPAEEEVQCEPVSNYQAECWDPDSDEEQQKRMRKRRTTARKLIESYVQEHI